MTLESTGLCIQPLQCEEFLLLSELRFLNGCLEHLDRSVIDAQRHRERVTVLSPMSEGESRRITEAAGRAMNDFRDHGQRLHGPEPHAGGQQQVGEVHRPAISRRRKASMQPAEYHVT
jgi:hypothetical protein